MDRGSGYSKKYLDKVEIICYDIKVYILQTLNRRVIYWYHLYINHPGGSRLDKTVRYVCYWKGLVTQEDMYSKPCNIFQQQKNRSTLYERFPPKKISELKPLDTVYIYLIGPYNKSIRQHQMGVYIIKNNVSITCMTMIDPATGWF